MASEMETPAEAEKDEEEKKEEDEVYREREQEADRRKRRASRSRPKSSAALQFPMNHRVFLTPLNYSGLVSLCTALPLPLWSVLLGGGRLIRKLPRGRSSEIDASSSTSAHSYAASRRV